MMSSYDLLLRLDLADDQPSGRLVNLDLDDDSTVPFTGWLELADAVQRLTGGPPGAAIDGVGGDPREPDMTDR